MPRGMRSLLRSTSLALAGSLLLNLLLPIVEASFEVLRVAQREASAQGLAPTETSPPIAVQKASVDVASGQAGQLKSPDGKVALDLPATAVSENLRIEYEELQAGPTTGMKLVKQFKLNAIATARANAPVSQFSKPLGLTLFYSEDDVRGLDLSSFRLFYLEELNNRWIPLLSQLDVTARTLTAQTDHFSIFGAQANPAYSLPGRVMDFQVDLNTGAATVRYPLELPRAPGGSQPGLELVYHSGSVDEMKNRRDVGSWVGIGWSLDLGHIFYNEEKSQYYIQFNGISSKLVQDTNPASPNRWYTIPDEHLKILKGVIGGYEAWEVWGRDGTYHVFGGSADAVQYRWTGTATVNYRFDLRLVQDPHGNKTKITYAQDLWNSTVRSAYPQAMSYDNDVGTETYHATLDFTSSYFENHPQDGIRRRDTPKGTSANPAPPVVENKYLGSVDIKVDTVVARSYAFTYTTTDAVLSADYGGIWYAGAHKLTSITAKGLNGAPTDTTTSFQYNNLQVYFRAPEGDHKLIVADATATEELRLHDFNGLGDPIDSRTLTSLPSDIAIDNRTSPNNWIMVAHSGGSYSWLKRCDESWVVCNDFQVLSDPRGLGWGKLQYNSDWVDAVWVASYGASVVEPWSASGWNFGGTKQISVPSPPLDVAYDSRGFIYVSDVGNKIRRYSVAESNYGALLNEWNRSGTTPDSLLNPRGLAIDGYYLYVADSQNSRIQKYDVSNPDLLVHVAGFGTAQLLNPVGIDIHGGYLYVTDEGGDKALAFTLGGTFLREWKTWQKVNAGAPPTYGTLLDPKGIGGFDKTGAAGPNPGNPAQLTWPYLSSATNELGGTVAYTYTQKPTPPVDNVWTRQIVTSIVRNPQIGSSVTTSYAYAGNPSVNPAYPEYYVVAGDYRGAEYRGFREVTVTRQDNTYEKHLFFTTGSFTVQHPLLGSQIRSAEYFRGREYSLKRYAADNTLLQEDFTEWDFGTPTVTWPIQPKNAGLVVGAKKVWTYYIYDDYGNITQERFEGATTAAGTPDGDEHLIQHSFQPNTTAWIINKLAEKTLYEGVSSVDSARRFQARYYYDGATLHTTAPTKGDLTKVEGYQSVGSWATTAYDYDAYGNRTSETDPNGKTTTTVIDATYHAYPTKVTYPTVGGLVLSKDYTWDYRGGVLLSESGLYLQGNSTVPVTSYEYDTLWRLTKVIKPFDTSASPTVTYSYNSLGQVGSQHVRVQQKVSATDSVWAEEYIDGLGRIVQVRQRDVSPNHLIASTTAFDGRGLLANSYVPWQVADTTSSAYQAPPSGTRSTSYAYDGLARVTSETAPDGAATAHSYAVAPANLMLWEETVTDPLGHKRRSTTDTRGNLAKVEELDAAQAVYSTTTYTYDVLGNLKQLQDTAGNLTTMTYDWLSRKTAMTDPDMGSWSYAYDAKGNLTSQTDAKAQTIVFEYDALDRMTKRCTPACTGTVLATSAYDAYDPATGQYGRGRRTGLTDPSGSTTSTYDQRGRLTKEVRVIDVSPYTTQYAYDAADRRTAVTYPTGETATQAYDSRGLPSTLSSSASGTLVSATAYNKLSLPTEITLGNDLMKSTFGYWNLGAASDNNTDCQAASATDCFGRLWEMKTTKVSDSAVRLQARHTWDGAGNLTQRQDVQAAETESFTYDFLDRLASGKTTMDVTSGLVAHWKLDDGTGTTAADSSGSGNPGTLVNGPLWVDGRLDKALQMDGVNDYLNVPTFVNLPSSTFTVAAWARVDVHKNWNRLVGHDWCSNGGWLLFSSADGTVGFGVTSPDCSAQYTTFTPMTAGAWHHVAGTYDGSVIRLYLDGVEKSSRAASGLVLDTVGSVQVSYGDGTNTLDGTIDDVRIYNRALSSAEVAVLNTSYSESYTYSALGNITQRNGDTYTYGAKPHAVTQVGATASLGSGQIAHWKLDDDTGTTAADSSGTGNAGTLTNGPDWVDGRLDKALQTDGVNDYVDVSTFTNLPTSALSVSAWVKLDLHKDYHRLVHHDWCSEGGWLLFTVANGTAGFGLSGAGCAAQYTTFAPVNTGVWHHLAGTYDGSVVRLYVDGTERSSRAGVTQSLDAAGSVQLSFGNGADTLDGTIDEVRIYNRALSAIEIETLYNTYAYDANGSMTARGGQTLSWSVENRLAQVLDGTVVLEALTYDGDGQRVKKVAGTATVHYPNRSYEKNVTTGEETLSYYHGDRLVAVKRGGVLSYLHQDHLGGTVLATDTAGSTVSSMKYLPYGEERSSSGLLPTSRRFTGQRWDNPANLYDYNARSYDPALGRFISADTIVPDASNPQAFSRYSYVVNNPLKYTDPSGHCPWCMVGGFLATRVGQALVVGATAIAAQLWWQLSDAGEDAQDAARDFLSGTAGQPGDPNDPFRKVSGRVQSYGSFRAFKEAMGSAGKDKEWHHIVEQNPANSERFTPRMLHNTDNVITLDAKIHDEISAYYSSIRRVTGGRVTVRDWLSSQSYEEQYKFGLDILNKVLRGVPLP